jgi:hypothetical protein
MCCAIVDLPQPDVPTTEMRIAASSANGNACLPFNWQTAFLGKPRQIFLPNGIANGPNRAHIPSEHKENFVPALARTQCLPPSAVAFWKRNAAGGGKKQANNQTDIIQLNQTLKRSHQKLPCKNKAGAPKGNRNAWRNGRYAKEAIACRRRMTREVRAVIAQMRLLAAQYRAEAALKDAQTLKMLLDAALPHRAMWFGEY